MQYLLMILILYQLCIYNPLSEILRNKLSDAWMNCYNNKHDFSCTFGEILLLLHPYRGQQIHVQFE